VTVPPLEEAGSDVGVTVSMVETGAAAAGSTPAEARRGAVEQPAWEPGKALLDDFVVEQHLGRGGMGDVYLVRSRSTSQPFAVKRILPERLSSERSRRLFLAELRAWIDLPEHPNLAACRFFRSVEGQTVIFAEYVSGGSLDAWIRVRKLTGLKQILDVAIQIAWGLEESHVRGLVHQDVKPANVLISAEGVPKVTDFGLAKGRAVVEAVEEGGEAASADVTGAAGTPAYCSPEQAERRRLTEKTDLWSWGLTVLEMFTGPRTWSSGVAAPKVLELRLNGMAAGDRTSFAVPMPPSVADVLRRCFQREPADRWDSLAKAADALAAAYRTETGKPYPRERPASAAARSTVAEHDRRTATGVTWTDPQEWLRKAPQAAGRDPTEANRFAVRRTGSRQAQAIDDLIVYEEAQQIFIRLVASGRKDLERALAMLCIDKALVHGSAGDMPGAVAQYGQAIEIRERLVYQEGQRELANDLAKCYLNKAVSLWALGDNWGAVALYEKAIEIRERLVNQEGRRELAHDLARCYMNKGLSVGDLGDSRGELALYEQAIEIRRRLVHQEGRRELAGDLAWLRLYWANAANKLGRHDEAVRAAGEAAHVLQAEIDRTGRADLQGVLDWAKTDLADLL